MAAVMAGVMHAPLTGIFLIAEITGGYQMFIPLMIVSICAYLTIILFEPHSIYGMRLAREGKLITHHTDRAVLTLMNIDSVIDKTYHVFLKTWISAHWYMLSVGVIIIFCLCLMMVEISWRN